jgi:hypothetical protein
VQGASTGAQMREAGCGEIGYESLGAGSRVWEPECGERACGEPKARVLEAGCGEPGCGEPVAGSPVRPLGSARVSVALGPGAGKWLLSPSLRPAGSGPAAWMPARPPALRTVSVSVPVRVPVPIPAPRPGPARAATLTTASS